MSCALMYTYEGAMNVFEELVKIRVVYEPECVRMSVLNEFVKISVLTWPC